MGTMWVLTANRGYAKIYEVKGKGREIKEIFYLENPHRKGTDVLSDRPGRAFDRLGMGRHALSTEVDFHEHELEQFAHKITDYLIKAHESKLYEQLALVAPSHFLGDLNKIIPATIRKIIIQEVDSNLPEHLSEQDRIAHLRKYLDLWNESKASPRVIR